MNNNSLWYIPSPRIYFFGLSFCFLFGSFLWYENIPFSFAVVICLILWSIIALVPRYIIAISIMIGTFCIGYIHGNNSYTEYFANSEFLIQKTEWGTKTIELTGTIQDYGSVQNEKIRYRLKIDNFDTTSPNNDIFLTLVLWWNMNLKPWDRVFTETKIQLINGDVRQSFVEYNRYNRIYGTITPYNLRFFPPQEYSLSTRMHTYIEEVTSLLFPASTESLIRWMIIGDTSTMSEEDSIAYQDSWLLHIVAVSGANITLILLFLDIILFFLPPSIRIILVCLSVWIFIAIVWWTPPAIRAGFMGTIIYVTSFHSVGRKIFSPALLMVFILGYVFLHPWAIPYDLSFLLSCSAVLWILTLEPQLRHIFDRWRNTLLIKESFILTISAMIYTLPISILWFWYIPTFAIFANILASFAIPTIMIGGWITFFWYMIHPYLGYVLWYIPHMMAHYIRNIGYFFHELPFSRMEIPASNSIDIGGIILIIGLIFFSIHTFTFHNFDKK